jgi:hypothetical protein
MTDDLLYNLVECNRRTAIDESNKDKVAMLYEMWNHIPADNDYQMGVRAGIMEAICVITGDYSIYFRNALVPDEVKSMSDKTVKALEKLQYGSWDK